MASKAILRSIQIIIGGALLSSTHTASTMDNYPQLPVSTPPPPPYYQQPTDVKQKNSAQYYIDSLQQELNRLYAEIQRLHYDRQNMLNELQHAQHQIQQQNDQLAWLNEQYRQQLATQSTLQQQLAAANTGYENEWRRAEYLLQQGSKQQHTRIQQLEFELAQLREQLQQRGQQIASLSAQPPSVTAMPEPPPSRSEQNNVNAEQQLALDRLTACVDTAAAASMNISECSFDQPMMIEGISFEYDSHELTAESRQILEKVSRVLKTQPSVQLEIAGHTDTQGHPAYNMWLSQLRAESVRDFLIEQGVSAANLIAKGYGGKQPIADNSTWNGLHKNRRVEFRFLGNASQLTGG